MNALEAAVLVLVLFLPLHLLVLRQAALLADPEHLRSQGVVIVREEVLDAREGHAGTYMGRAIPAQVTFLGMPYRFDHIAETRCREKTGPGELWLEPGLVYVAV